MPIFAHDPALRPSSESAAGSTRSSRSHGSNAAFLIADRLAAARTTQRSH